MEKVFTLFEKLGTKKLIYFINEFNLLNPK
jgi:hypothetical protein